MSETWASDRIHLCHSPEQLVSALRSTFLAGPLVWNASGLYTPPTWILTAVDDCSAVRLHLRADPSFGEFNNLHTYFIATFLKAETEMPAISLAGCGSWSGGGLMTLGLPDPDSVTHAELLFTSFVSMKHELFEAWTDGNVLSTSGTFTSYYGDNVRVRISSSIYTSHRNPGTFHEIMTLSPSHAELGGSTAESTIVGQPVPTPGGSSSFTTSGAEVAASIRDLANRDLGFSLSPTGPHLSLFSRSVAGGS